MDYLHKEKNLYIYIYIPYSGNKVLIDYKVNA